MFRYSTGIKRDLLFSLHVILVSQSFLYYLYYVIHSLE